jgi:hypothetical protein
MAFRHKTFNTRLVGHAQHEQRCSHAMLHERIGAHAGPHFHKQNPSTILYRLSITRRLMYSRQVLVASKIPTRQNNRFDHWSPHASLRYTQQEMLPMLRLCTTTTCDNFGKQADPSPIQSFCSFFPPRQPMAWLPTCGRLLSAPAAAAVAETSPQYQGHELIRQRQATCRPVIARPAAALVVQG